MLRAARVERGRITRRERVLGALIHYVVRGRSGGFRGSTCEAPEDEPGHCKYGSGCQRLQRSPAASGVIESSVHGDSNGGNRQGYRAVSPIPLRDSRNGSAKLGARECHCLRRWRSRPRIRRAIHRFVPCCLRRPHGAGSCSTHMPSRGRLASSRRAPAPHWLSTGIERASRSEWRATSHAWRARKPTPIGGATHATHSSRRWPSMRTWPPAGDGIWSRPLRRYRATGGGKTIRRPVNWVGYRLTPDSYSFWHSRAHRLNDGEIFFRAKGGWRRRWLPP
jgi:Pyridoxine 5'-phosphate oxidase C-terminal dimerisation region